MNCTPPAIGKRDTNGARPTKAERMDIMRGSEKQIRWAEELIETVTSILTKGLDIIESEDAPESNKETARVNIARKIAGIKSAAYAGDVINLFKGIYQTDDPVDDFMTVMAVYRTPCRWSDGEKAILEGADPEPTENEKEEEPMNTNREELMRIINTNHDSDIWTLALTLKVGYREILDSFVERIGERFPLASCFGLPEEMDAVEAAKGAYWRIVDACKTAYLTSIPREAAEVVLRALPGDICIILGKDIKFNSGDFERGWNKAHPEEKPIYRPEEWLFCI